MDAYIGEIRAFPYNFVPRYWLGCFGQTVSVRDYQALYALIGNTYGGTAAQTFVLPNFQSRAPIGLGTGTGLTPRLMGKSYGEASVPGLTNAQMPPHSHAVNMQNPVMSNLRTNMQTTPVANSSWLARAMKLTSDTTSGGIAAYTKYTGQPTTGTLDPRTVGAGGGGGVSSHENRQPYLTFTFCICWGDGTFPDFN